jgi:hypothetical protein
MDTQQFMENYVARQLDESPTKVTDPQIELLQGLSREADLDSRPALAHEPQSDDDSPREVSPAAESVTETPAAEPQIHTSTESLSAVAASPSVEHGFFPDPVLPMDSVSPAAELFTQDTTQDASGFAEPQEPQEATEQPEPVPATPSSFLTGDARPASLVDDPGVNVDVAYNGNNTTETITPDALPIDFNQALLIARNQVELPTIVAGDKSLRDIMPDLPDFDIPDVRPSTEFAEQKLTTLSDDLQRWGRHV